MPNHSPRMVFVGPMIGRNPGQVTTQGEILSDHFTDIGYQITCVSSHPNRYVRLLDIVWTLLRDRRKYEIMILHIFGGPSFVVEDIASWLGQLFGIKMIFLLQGGALPDFFARWPNWTRRVLRRAHRFVAPSTYLTKAIIPYGPYGFNGRVIPNIIDMADYPFRLRDKPAPKFFWMRSFHEVWNPLMAIRVLAKLRQQVPAATMVMGGQNKGLEDECKRQAQALGLGAAIEFPGFVNPAQKKAYGEACDIYLNTNRIDNMPVAVVEACAFGMPVVATEVGGIPDLLTHGETGLFVEVDDDDAMVAAILRLLNEPQLAARLSNNGRRLAEQSSWDTVRKDWETIFDELSSTN